MSCDGNGNGNPARTQQHLCLPELDFDPHSSNFVDPDPHTIIADPHLKPYSMQTYQQGINIDCKFTSCTIKKIIKHVHTLNFCFRFSL